MKFIYLNGYVDEEFRREIKIEDRGVEIISMYIGNIRVSKFI